MQSLRQFRRLGGETQDVLVQQKDLESSGDSEAFSTEEKDGNGSTNKVITVDWEDARDPLNPANFNTPKRISVTLLIALVAFVLQAGASSDSAVAPQAAKSLGVSPVAESLATAMYLIGMGAGTLVCGPFSETFGRNLVYIGSLIFFLAWELGAALSPNIGAQIIFRFLAGSFASPCLTVAGGTIADVWNPLEKTWAFPLFAITGFGGPFLGPVISSWIGDNGYSWRWADWLIVILTGFVLATVILLQPETFGPILLKWKAKQLRASTDNNRYQASIEHIPGFMDRLAISMKRPFEMALREIILLLFTLYLTVAYIVIFTFLNGYTYIYSETYGFSQTLTEVSFTAIFVGVLLSIGLVPWVYQKTKSSRDNSLGHDGIQPELRLWYAMFGAPWMPISLFWMGWTNFPTISPWSVIVASIFFGFSVICIFLSAYMYIIDSYGAYAASALTFVALVRYLVAGGMTVVSIPFYENMGTHYTLTILACISAVMVPVPYVLYFAGPRIRKSSRFAA